MNINSCYKEAMTDEEPIMLLYGSRGSGKSVFAAQKLVIRILSEEGHKALCVRKFAVNLRNSVFAEIVNVINTNGFSEMFDVITSPLEITCKHNGNKILFYGADDTEKLKSISGITIVFCEEATQLTEADFSQIDLSVRGKSKFYKQIMMCFNPTDKKSWIYKSFFVKKLYKCSIYHTTYKQNPFVDVVEYERKLEQYKENKNYYGVVALGLWGEQTEAQIFTNWEIDNTISTNHEFYKSVRGGVDFGWSDANTVVLCSLIENTIYIFKELYLINRTGNDLIKVMLQDFPLDIYYVADSSQPAQITEMNRAGIKTLSVSKNKIIDGLAWIQGKKIKVHPSCVHMIQELELYQYRVNKDGVILNEPLDANNHLIDALRYSLRDLMQPDSWGTASATLRI